MATANHSIPELLPKGHPGRARSCLARIYALQDLANTMGSGDIRKEAIDLAREVMDLLPEENPERVDAQLMLASSLSKQYGDHDDISIIDEAIQVGQDAIPLCPRGHRYHSLSRVNLANSLKARFERTGGDQLLEDSITLLREVLEMSPQDDPNREFPCGSLANALRMHYKSNGDVSLLVEAISLQREALIFCPEGHSRHPGRSEDLAISLFSLYEHSGDLNILTEVIDIQRTMLNSRLAADPDRMFSYVHLATSLRVLYIRNGDESTLMEAIYLQREALSICPAGHPFQQAIWANLAIGLNMRYERTGDQELLNEAIYWQVKDMNACPPYHPSRVISCSYLANSLCMLYMQERDVDILFLALGIKREALAMCPKGHPYRAGICGTLANILILLYQLTSGIHLLDEAADMAHEELSSFPEGHPSRFRACGALANTLQMRHDDTGDAQSYENIVSLYKQAISDAPSQMLWRYACGLSWAHIRRDSCYYDVDKAVYYLSLSLDNDPDDLLQAVTTILSRLDDIWSDGSSHIFSTLTIIYERLISLLPLLANSAFDLRSQLKALRNGSRVGPDAFVCSALTGDWKLGLEMLEALQGLLWSQQLHLRNPQLPDVPAELAAEFEVLLKAMSTRTVVQHIKTSLTPRDVLLNQNSRLHALISEIRAFPGLDRFMLGETFEDLCQVASRHPVVVLVGARDHYYALILTSTFGDTHELLSLKLKDDDLKGISAVYSSGPSNRGAEVKGDETEDDFDERKLSLTRTRNSVSVLNRSLRFIWEQIVKPVIDYLRYQPSTGRARPRLYWCPTGAFSTLPIHAAGIYDVLGAKQVGTASYVVSSYTPTLSTLLRLQKSAVSIARGDVSIALVAEKQARGTDLPTIPSVEEEITIVVDIANSHGMKITHQLVGSTTVESTYAAIQGTNIVHLACHGLQDTDNATQSGFHLGDGRLTIDHLAQTKLDQAFLAFLSACETARGDTKQPDQVMHLAAAMLFCGFKNVIATMWAIADVDGPRIAKWFYEELFNLDILDVDAVAYAFDFAIGQLRESGVSAQRWAPFIHMGA